MAKIDSAIGEMGTRSFNASYLLPFKRKMAGPKKKTRKKAAKKTSKAKAPQKNRSRRAAAQAQGERAGARELVLERDQKVLAMRDGDPKAAYELGASIDEYLDRLAALL